MMIYILMQNRQTLRSVPLSSFLNSTIYTNKRWLHPPFINRTHGNFQSAPEVIGRFHQYRRQYPVLWTSVWSGAQPHWPLFGILRRHLSNFLSHRRQVSSTIIITVASQQPLFTNSAAGAPPPTTLFPSQDLSHLPRCELHPCPL